MHKPSYYREQSERAYRLARSQARRDVREHLESMARDYAELAEDLESGAVEIRHRELLRPPRH